MVRKGSWRDAFGAFSVYLFILRERERERGRECDWGRGRERIPSRLSAVVAEPDVGLDLPNREVTT